MACSPLVFFPQPGEQFGAPALLGFGEVPVRMGQLDEDAIARSVCVVGGVEIGGRFTPAASVRRRQLLAGGRKRANRAGRPDRSRTSPHQDRGPRRRSRLSRHELRPGNASRRGRRRARAAAPRSADGVTSPWRSLSRRHPRRGSAKGGSGPSRLESARRVLRPTWTRLTFAPLRNMHDRRTPLLLHGGDEPQRPE
jgi:hypothetical protein